MHRNFRLRLIHVFGEQTVVTSEGFTRMAVQKRMESRKKQLDIAVGDVQRVYRGHLGRRRMRARATQAWELKLEHAARVIQRMYRDMVDRQWAEYVRQGNLQVLVANKMARKARGNKSPEAGTAIVKPPIRRYYPADVIKNVSTLSDGVPLRALLSPPRHKQPTAAAPSMPSAIRIRRRWGLPHTVDAYDGVTRDLVEAARRLNDVAADKQNMYKTVATDTSFDTQHDAHEEEERRLHGLHSRRAEGLHNVDATQQHDDDDDDVDDNDEGHDQEGATQRFLGDTDKERRHMEGTQSWESARSRASSALRRISFPDEGPSMPQRRQDALPEAAYLAGLVDKGARIGMFTLGGRQDGLLEHELGEGGLETPPELFGTDDDVYRHGQAGQIMPDYLRKQVPPKPPASYQI
jgi:hypothetical protein